MKIENWLYFRTVADEDDDDGDNSSAQLAKPTSICLPVSAIRQVNPTGTTGVKINIDSVIVNDSLGGGMHTRYTGHDTITLTTTVGKAHEVAKALAEVISGNNQFTVIADDMTTNAANATVAARYFHPDVTGCGDIVVYKTKQGLGMHEYYEVVSTMAADDDDVAGSLSISLPAQCIILEAAMITRSLATNNVGSVALEIHTAAIADDAESAGTEILGANTLNLAAVVANNTDSAGGANDFGDSDNKTGDNTSIPSADLDISSDAIANDTIHSGVMDPIDRGTAVTHFQVTAKEDMKSTAVTGSPKVGVYIKWWGAGATALA